MKPGLIRGGIFLLAFCALLSGAVIAWEIYVAQKIYYCTDYIFLDFLSPGDWIHPRYGDKLQPGWTEQALWSLWLSLFFSAVLGAFIFAVLFRLKRKRSAPD